jgi:hypothetical protein
MKKIPTSTALIICLCLCILGIFGYLNMTTGNEIPGSLIAVFSSVLSGIVGYEAGRNVE